MALINSPDQAVTISGPAVKGNQYPALITLGVLYFMMGFITCLNDSLVPFFKAGFRLSYSESSLVQFYFFLTYALISAPAGRVVGRIGYKNGMVMGFLVAAFGALLFFPASVYHVYALFLAALFILAAGIVVLQVSANPYITVLGPAETASSRLTLIQGVGSIGTTVAPVFGAYFLLSSLQPSNGSSEAVRLPYLGIGACLLLIAVIVWRLKLPRVQAGHTGAAGVVDGARSIWSFRNLNFGIAAIFMYVGAEVSIGTFLTGYISDRVQVSADAANRYVAFYWGGMLAGRLLGSVLLQRVRPQRVLAVLSAAAIALILASLCCNGYVAVWTMIATGVCNSVMFAVVFSLSIQGLGKYITRASGLLSTAIAGGAVVSFLQGLLKDHYSWAVAFMAPVVCYGYLVFFGVNGYRKKRAANL